MEARSIIGESTDAVVMDDSPTDETQDACQRLVLLLHEHVSRSSKSKLILKREIYGMRRLMCFYPHVVAESIVQRSSCVIMYRTGASHLHCFMLNSSN